jgi:hypothetical protein
METKPLSLLRDDDRERGAALIMAIFFVLMLVAFSYLVLRSYRAQSSMTMFKVRHSALFADADTGLAKGKLILTSNPTNANYTGSNGNPFQIHASDNAVVTVELIGPNSNPYTYRLISNATDPANGQVRSVEMILMLEENRDPTNAPGMGAVVANGNLQVTGNIKVDGNDHDPDGTPGGQGNDVPGVVTTGTVSQDGSSDIGGGGQAAGSSPTEGQGIDNSTLNWEPESTLAGGTAADDTDGVDNDGDGVVDEDGFPDTAGEVFGFQGNDVGDPADDNDSLKNQAQNDGTYFTSYADYDTWRSSATQADQGGKVIYIEVANGTAVGNFKLPDNPPPATPSIVVVAGQDPSVHDTEIGPVHGSGAGKHFQGLIIADTYKNINGNGKLTGSMIAFNPGDTAHLGNGNFDILFSSEVLGNLPGINQAPVPWTPEVLNWREIENR